MKLIHPIYINNVTNNPFRSKISTLDVCMHIITYNTNSGTPMNFINTSLQNDNGHVKKEVIIKVIIHEI